MMAITPMKMSTMIKVKVKLKFTLDTCHEVPEEE
jgi:hypothetical protein